MKYSFNKKITLVREEGNGNYLLIGEGAKFNLVINETGYDVYKVLDKYEDIDEIVDYMKEMYRQVDERVLRKDIYEIMKCFEVYGLVKIEDEEVVSTDEREIKYVVNGDIYYKKVSNYILGEMNTDGIKLCANEKEYYSVVSMRMRVMRNVEYQIFAEKDGIVNAYASVTCSPIDVSKVLVIKELVFKAGLSNEQIMVYLNGIINRAYRLYANHTVLSKVRVSFYDKTINKRLIDILENMGFGESVCLKDETVLGNLYYYDFLLNN